MCGYTETFCVLYACSTTLCLLSVLTKWDYEPEKNSWFYTQLSVEGAMLLLNLIFVGYMFIKDIFS